MLRIVSRVRQHLADTESHHRKIAVGFVWVSLFVFVGKLAGAAKEMAVAWRYGVSETVDAYVFVFNLISWPVSVWFTVLTIVLVPLFARILHDLPEELPRFRSELLGLSLIIALGLGVLAWVSTPLLVQADWVGLSDQSVAVGLKMIGGLSLLAPMGVLIGLFSAWMLACGRHSNTLFEAIPALAILAVLLLPSNWISDPLLWGTVVGCAIHMAVLAASLIGRAELQLPSFKLSSPAWQGLWGGAAIMVVGSILMSSTAVIDQFFAAQIGPGALSTLNYANKILALLLSIGAMTISRALLPVFSEIKARDGIDIYPVTIFWMKWIFISGIFLSAFVWCVSPFLVQVLFERGAFNQLDTERVSLLLSILACQLPFYFVGTVLMQYLVTQRQFKRLILSYFVALATKFTVINAFLPDMSLHQLAFSMVVFIVAWALSEFILVFRPTN